MLPHFPFFFLTLAFLLPYTLADYKKLKLGGECEALRVQLEGTDNSTEKLSKLNEFLDSIGEEVREKFWDIIAAAKTDAQNNLPSETAKTLAAGVIGAFEDGDLFLPHEKVSSELKSKFESLDEADQSAVRNLAKVYGKQIKALVLPVLPANCKPASEGSDSAGNSTVDTADFVSRKKRELFLIDNLTAAFREYRRRRQAV